jgi:hypothetical protein
MEQRKQVCSEAIAKAFDSCIDKMFEALKKKGSGAFVSSHEILGVLTEEYDEVKLAVHENDIGWLKAELMDVVVAAIFSLASIETIQLTKSEKISIS